MTDFTAQQWQLLDRLIKQAFAEDSVNGDITSTALYGNDNVPISGMIVAKAAGVVAGLPIAERCFSTIDTTISFNARKQDGDIVSAGEVLVDLGGTARNILLAERIALNFLSHMSGVATLTRQFVDKIVDYNCEILDTRKTLPGLRLIQKYAVRMGGGSNHRMNLYEMGMIKDNHIVLHKMKHGDEPIAAFIQRIKAINEVPVLLEIDSLDQIEEAKNSGADIVMLDNFPLEQCRSAVELLADTDILVESSGNVQLDTVADIAATGVHRISIGRLTHSVKALDISLDVSGSLK